MLFTYSPPLFLLMPRLTSLQITDSQIVSFPTGRDASNTHYGVLSSYPHPRQAGFHSNQGHATFTRRSEGSIHGKQFLPARTNRGGGMRNQLVVPGRMVNQRIYFGPRWSRYDQISMWMNQQCKLVFRQNRGSHQFEVDGSTLNSFVFNLLLRGEDDVMEMRGERNIKFLG